MDTTEQVKKELEAQGYKPMSVDEMIAEAAMRCTQREAAETLVIDWSNPASLTDEKINADISKICKRLGCNTSPEKGGSL